MDKAETLRQLIPKIVKLVQSQGYGLLNSFIADQFYDHQRA